MNRDFAATQYIGAPEKDIGNLSLWVINRLAHDLQARQQDVR